MRSHFFKELKVVLANPDLWLYMAWIDVKLRYKRTKLGPFWMVIVSFISIVCIAGLGSLLFRVRFGEFFPYVTCGMVVWNYMAVLITDSCVVFIMYSGIIKHINIPLLSLALRMFCRNSIVFLHSLLVVGLVLLYYQVPLGMPILILVPAIALFAITAVSVAVILGLICARFRDVLQLVQALISILAFLTPIMWRPEMLGEYAYLVNFNPLTHYVAIIREPLLGHFPTFTNCMAAIGVSAIFFLLANTLFNKYRKHLVYWL